MNYDNTHISKYLNEYLSKSYLTLFLHQPYSPDLSLRYICFFITMKDIFQGISFDSEKDHLYEFYSKYNKTFWMSIFENWLE